MSIAFRCVVSAVALAAALGACTPLQVVTHTVTQTEARVPVGEYELDPHHTSVTFDVDHFRYSHFMMRFDRVAGQIDWKEGGLDKSQVTVTIDAASIDTNVAQLDKMVKGSDMLEAERNPQIRFVSTRFERTGDARGKLTGDLTIRGVTQPVTLDVTFNGYGRDPLTKADTLGFSADGRFSRSKFGLTTWYPAVGDEIHVVIQTEAARPPAG
ncbi:YceI family protein [Paraburkholderia sp. LEh10]|uniref:YceI family protein n=1 Tax=Paraburkholderia sp. LEh10 TaxID=2821353 RepID=UPI001AE3AC8B|nr:YceI family protein [Paraburkholderia sp. LEh10]MBP0592332.1 YceI family protein [Paraburkholderia sp. LEh10]